MNRISKLLSILALLSFGLSTEKSEEEAIENKVSIEENKSEDVSVNEETPAIDIERITQIRQTKARLDNKHAQRVLHNIKTSQKSDNSSKNKTISKADLIQKIKKSIKAPFQVVQIKNINGERVVELPSATETN